MSQPLHASTITSLPKIHAGKVRDIFGIGEKHMLLVSTDRTREPRFTTPSST